jgi:heptosyltransferase II
MGDTVMAVPTLRALREVLPHAELWCLGPWVPSILEAEPTIDRRLAAPHGWRARRALARQMRRAAIDLAILLPNSLGAAVDAWRQGGRWRVGYATDGRTWLLTHALPPSTMFVHQVDAYLGLLRPLGVKAPAGEPTLTVSPTRRAEAARLLAEIGLGPGERTVGIQLGAAFGPSKLWPADRLAALASWLERRGVPAVLLGDGSAAPLVGAVEAALGHPPRSLVGRDHPALLPALLAGFAVVVSPDSGPAHVAAAVGVPVITLFGPTDPRLTAPRGGRPTVLWRKPACAPCFQRRCPIDHRCMTALALEAVGAAIWDRLAA